MEKSGYGWDLLCLVRHALRGEQAPEELAKRAGEGLFAYAREQSLAAMASFALEGDARWKEERERSLRKNILLELERAAICAFMEERGIWYVVLKGSVLKELYPRMEMRQFTDLDILIDPKGREALAVFMKQRGYTPTGREDSHHDVYQKPPLYDIELHHTLFDPHCELALVGYYKDIAKRLVCLGGQARGFRDEDLYVYVLAHAYKHYVERGVGLRALVDLYVLEQKPLDWDYIRTECGKLEMEAFYLTARSLANKLLGAGEALTEPEQALLEYCMDAGTHGSEAGHIRKELRENSKAKYLWGRLFPSPSWMRQKNKMVREHPWTLPFAWGGRLIRGAFRRRKHTVQELKIVFETEQ